MSYSQYIFLFVSVSGRFFQFYFQSLEFSLLLYLFHFQELFCVFRTFLFYNTYCCVMDVIWTSYFSEDIIVFGRGEYGGSFFFLQCFWFLLGLFVWVSGFYVKGCPPMSYNFCFLPIVKWERGTNISCKTILYSVPRKRKYILFLQVHVEHSWKLNKY